MIGHADGKLRRPAGHQPPYDLRDRINPSFRRQPSCPRPARRAKTTISVVYILKPYSNDDAFNKNNNGIARF
eukprot:scaffold192453_cov38-Prasinocladus_malaysianus.AAC.1